MKPQLVAHPATYGKSAAGFEVHIVGITWNRAWEHSNVLIFIRNLYLPLDSERFDMAYTEMLNIQIYSVFYLLSAFLSNDVCFDRNSA